MLTDFIPLLIPDGDNEWMWTGKKNENLSYAIYHVEMFKLKCACSPR